MDETTDNPTLPDRIYIDADFDPVEDQGHGGFFIKPFATGKSVEYVRAPIVAPQGENGEQLPDSRGNYTDGFRDGWKAHFDASPASSPVPHSAGFDDAARVSRVLNQVAATPTPVEQEQVQCADCLEWIDRNANHNCRQQVRRNQRSAK